MKQNLFQLEPTPLTIYYFKLFRKIFLYLVNYLKEAAFVGRASFKKRPIYVKIGRVVSHFKGTVLKGTYRLALLVYCLYA